MKNLILIFLCLFYTANSLAVIKVNETPRLKYNLAVQMGKVSNASVAHGFFESTDLTTTEKTVWDGPGIYVYPDGLVNLTVSSSSTADTLAGTGAQKISIDCLDINYEPFTDIIELDGRNPVSMPGKCFRLQGTGTKVIQVGVGEQNAGTIYVGTGEIDTGEPAVIYNLINISENLSDSGFFTIPVGFTGYFYDVQASSVSNKPLKMRGLTRNGIPVFLTFWSNNIDGYVDSKPSFPDRFEEKSDIQFRATMDSGAGAVNAHAHLLLIR